MQNQVGMGPIPTGSYSIGAPFHHHHAGDYAMRLTPNAGTDTQLATSSNGLRTPPASSMRNCLASASTS